MNAVVTIEGGESVKLNMSITLTLKEWRQLAEQLDEHAEYWPYRGFAAVIKNGITKASVRLLESSSVTNM